MFFESRLSTNEKVLWDFFVGEHLCAEVPIFPT